MLSKTLKLLAIFSGLQQYQDQVDRAKSPKLLKDERAQAFRVNSNRYVEQHYDHANKGSQKPANKQVLQVHQLFLIRCHSLLRRGR